MRYPRLAATIVAFGLFSQAVMAQDNVKHVDVRLADGTRVSIPYAEGLPLPVENALFRISNAGFGVPTPKTATAPLTLKWIFELTLKTDVAVESILVEEVHQAVIPAAYLLDAKPTFSKGSWMAMTTEMPATKEAAPWLYRDENTLFVFRFTVRLKGAADVIAYQASIQSYRAKQGTVSRALENQRKLK